MENKLIVNTEAGPIEVIINNDGERTIVRVDAGGKQVSRIEQKKDENQFEAYLWGDGSEDFTAKEVIKPLPGSDENDYVRGLYADVESVLAEEGTKLTDEQLLSIVNRLTDYDYSDYNDYISELIETELSK